MIVTITVLFFQKQSYTVSITTNKGKKNTGASGRQDPGIQNVVIESKHADEHR